MKTKKEILLIEDDPYKRPPRFVGILMPFMVLVGIALCVLLCYGFIYMVIKFIASI